jgi:hypothetical protein
MSALWEAPFEKVLQLDADLVLWGDIRKNLPCGNWDFVYNEPHELITEYIQKSKPELLVMFTNREKGFFESLFLPSKSAELTYSTKIPVLIFSK